MATQLDTKRIRESLGLTQVEFAQLLGVHHGSVARWEQTRTAPKTRAIVRELQRLELKGRKGKATQSNSPTS